MGLPKRTKGKYVVFEGIDGSGKGTQLRLVLEKLSSNRIPFHETQEPTSSPVGKLLRETFLSGKYQTTEIVRQMLFATDRLDHFYKEDGVISKLSNGVNVISDRSYISGIAYAGTPGWDIYLGLRHWMIKPDLVIFLDVEPEVGIERISQGRQELEIYENLETLKSVRKRYLDTLKSLADDHGHNIRIHNSSGSIEQTHENIWRDLSALFK